MFIFGDHTLHGRNSIWVTIYVGTDTVDITGDECGNLHGQPTNIVIMQIAVLLNKYRFVIAPRLTGSYINNLCSNACKKWKLMMLGEQRGP